MENLSKIVIWKNGDHKYVQNGVTWEYENDPDWLVTIDIQSKNLKEKLAEFAHNQWSGWMRYLFEKSSYLKDGSAVIPKWAVERWTRQLSTIYEELSEEEKNSDRKEAEEMLNIFKKVFIFENNKR